MFCSNTCKQEAMSAYHTMEAALDLAPLITYCKHHDERFPLLVARAACMHLTQSSHLTEHPPSTNRTGGAAKARCSQGDIWQVQLWHLWSKSWAKSWQRACTATSCLPGLTILEPKQSLICFITSASIAYLSFSPASPLHVSCAQYRLHRQLFVSCTMPSNGSGNCHPTSTFSCRPLPRGAALSCAQHWYTLHLNLCSRITSF